MAEGTKAETLARSCARLIFTLYHFYFKADNKTHLHLLTHTYTQTHTHSHTANGKNRNDEL